MKSCYDGVIFCHATIRSGYPRVALCMLPKFKTWVSDNQIPNPLPYVPTKCIMAFFAEEEKFLEPSLSILELHFV